MRLNYFVGVDGVAIDVQSQQDLYDAIDALHSQVLENMGEASPVLPVLEEAMARLEIEFGLSPS